LVTNNLAEENESFRVQPFKTSTASYVFNKFYDLLQMREREEGGEEDREERKRKQTED
jgi:hypothetical protein